jgi:hypothetical protein
VAPLPSTGLYTFTRSNGIEPNRLFRLAPFVQHTAVFRDDRLGIHEFKERPRISGGPAGDQDEGDLMVSQQSNGSEH